MCLACQINFREEHDELERGHWSREIEERVYRDDRFCERCGKFPEGDQAQTCYHCFAEEAEVDVCSICGDENAEIKP